MGTSWGSIIQFTILGMYSIKKKKLVEYWQFHVIQPKDSQYIEVTINTKKGGDFTINY